MWRTLKAVISASVNPDFHNHKNDGSDRILYNIERNQHIHRRYYDDPLIASLLLIRNSQKTLEVQPNRMCPQVCDGIVDFIRETSRPYGIFGK